MNIYDWLFTNKAFTVVGLMVIAGILVLLTRWVANRKEK